MMRLKIGMKVRTKTELSDWICEGSHWKPRKFRSMSCDWKIQVEPVWSKSAQNIATKR